MELTPRKLVTIVTEAALEPLLAEDVLRLGAKGYTITEARGSGSRGVRQADWGAPSQNIYFQIVCRPETAEAILKHIQETYYAHYAMVAFVADVDVLRPSKF